MMGLAPGHVTDIPGLSRNDMLRLLGNGVVPRQGVAALQWLLPQLTGDVTVCQPTDSNAA
ncbi:hypothetical protein JOF56_011019 [Kibdelosporangium banguiense]|uniref:DNA (cytosine-5-)-methyltransferase n=1 Tax=Kibdelosporangium banguiense TaxID=1365924 RepID=A0ABS4U1V3_9PSEU|nr:hypothetical protein [Kibdelosporangium banguiense]MBP2330634.1 hypothetical protein [Kibdelosporangium banguiense]